MWGRKAAKSFSLWLQIAGKNSRHNLLPHLFLAVCLMVLTTVFFGTAQLGEQECAMPLELLFSLTGVILLTPVFWPEENERIARSVGAKYISPVCVFTIRIICSLLALVFLTLVFCGYMKLRGCRITWPLVEGTLANAAFLGSLGLLTSAVTGNTPVSYVTPALFYMLNYGAGDKLGRFYLFSMMRGDYTTTPCLLAWGGFLVMLALLVKTRFYKKL